MLVSKRFNPIQNGLFWSFFGGGGGVGGGGLKGPPS